MISFISFGLLGAVTVAVGYWLGYRDGKLHERLEVKIKQLEARIAEQEKQS